MECKVTDYAIDGDEIIVFVDCPSGDQRVVFPVAKLLQSIAENHNLLFDAGSVMFAYYDGNNRQEATIGDLAELIEHGTKYKTLVDFDLGDEVQCMFNTFYEVS